MFIRCFTYDIQSNVPNNTQIDNIADNLIDNDIDICTQRLGRFTHLPRYQPAHRECVTCVSHVCSVSRVCSVSHVCHIGGERLITVITQHTLNTARQTSDNVYTDLGRSIPLRYHVRVCVCVSEYARWCNGYAVACMRLST